MVKPRPVARWWPICLAGVHRAPRWSHQSVWKSQRGWFMATELGMCAFPFPLSARTAFTSKRSVFTSACWVFFSFPLRQTFTNEMQNIHSSDLMFNPQLPAERARRLIKSRKSHTLSPQHSLCGKLPALKIAQPKDAWKLNKPQWAKCQGRKQPLSSKMKPTLSFIFRGVTSLFNTEYNSTGKINEWNKRVASRAVETDYL